MSDKRFRGRGKGQTISLVALWLGLFHSAGAIAAVACSAYVGKAVLNEFVFGSTSNGAYFTEVMKVDPNVDLTGWKVVVYTSPSSSTAVSLPSSGSNSCYGGWYQTQQFSANSTQQNADIVLLDAANNVVDLLRVRTALPAVPYYNAPVPACSFIGAPTDIKVDASNKGVDRYPDTATGELLWRNTPGTGAGSYTTKCGPNVGDGTADLVITKTVNASSVVKGTDVSFTITVKNNGPDTAIRVLVNDKLPLTLGYSSFSVTKGTYDSTSGLWVVGDLVSGQNATLTLNATTPTVLSGITNTATTASSIFDPNIGNNSATATLAVTSPGATLDAVEVGAAAGTNIYTKLSGTDFKLDIVALDANSAVAPGYSKTVTIELVDASSTSTPPPTCSAMTPLKSFGSYTFTGSGSGKDNGVKTFTFNYANAARSVRVRMKDNSSTPIVACSTDKFAIRPLQFTVTSNMYNQLLTGTPKAVAGAAFTLTAGAGVTSGYDGTPAVDPTKVRDHKAAAISTGTLTGDFDAGTGAAASGSGFKYLDYGSIQFLNDAVVDSTFTSLDLAASDCIAGSTSNTLSGGKYGCNVGSAASNTFGRWYPSHYSFSGTLSPACGAGKFTYMGQDALGVVLSLKAHATTGATASAADPVLSRYTYDIPSDATKASVTISGDNNGTSVPITRLTSPAFPVTTSSALWSAGVFSINDTYAFSRSSSPDGPYDLFKLKVAITDPDATSPTLLGTETNTTKIRYGRLYLGNAYGSELRDLPIPLEAQYWHSAGYYFLNREDSCTSVPASAIVMSGFAQNLQACETNLSPSGSLAFSGGKPISPLKLTKPGQNNFGSVVLEVNVGGTPTGSTCLSSAASSATAASLQWFGNNPSARATFGIYKAPVIYRRENFY